MKKFLLIFGALLLGLSLVLALALPEPVQALPEYAAQTGEPCSTCHVSPSGGGPRGPRGQAWVASAKPSVVPNLTESLSLLGVELSVDEAYFTVTAPEVPDAEAPAAAPSQGQKLFHWLSQYDGN